MSTGSDRGSAVHTKLCRIRSQHTKTVKCVICLADFHTHCHKIYFSTKKKMKNGNVIYAQTQPEQNAMFAKKQ